MDREKRIIEKITNFLNPEKLVVKNNSALHSGHLGDDGTGQTHFYLEVKAQKLSELTRVKAHKIINELLAEEFENGLHALEIKVLR